MEDSILKSIPLFNQVLGVAVPLILAKLAYEQGVDLPVLILLAFLLGLFLNFAPAIFLDRTRWRELRWKDFICAMICGAIGAVQQNVSVISFGMVPSHISSTVAITVPIVLVSLNALSSLLKPKDVKTLWTIVGMTSVVGKGVAILTWIGAAIVSHPAIFQGPVILYVSNAHDLAPSPPPTHQNQSSMVILGSVCLCFAGSAPIATWFTNTVKEKMSSDFSHSFTMSTMIYFFGSIVAGGFAMHRDRNNEANELVLFTTLKVLDYISVFISVVLATGSTWCLQQEGPSYVAAFAYIYLIIEVIAVPLALDRKLHLRSVVGAVLLLYGIRVYNHWEAKAEAEIGPATGNDGNRPTSSEQQVGGVDLVGIIVS